MSFRVGATASDRSETREELMFIGIDLSSCIENSESFDSA
jgi:hypothetical protein